MSDLVPRNDRLMRAYLLFIAVALVQRSAMASTPPVWFPDF
jgi:hypothetical protein